MPFAGGNRSSSRAGRGIRRRPAAAWLRGVAVIAAVLVATAALPGAATAGGARVERLARLSGSADLPACSAYGATDPGKEDEPQIAVNPTDPDNLIAVWAQDRFHTEGSVAIVVGVTKDGGRTWTEQVVPGTLMPCTGGTSRRANDPWVAFGPDGVAYLSFNYLYVGEEPFPLVVVTGRGAIAASVSTDGGATWSQPRMITGADAFHDQASITADPGRPGTAYAVWTRVGLALTSLDSYFSRTEDGGRTWSAARRIYRGPPPAVAPGAGLAERPPIADALPSFAAPVSNVIRVLPDGTLVNMLVHLRLQDAVRGAGEAVDEIVVMRSTDRGRSWSDPVQVGATSTRRLKDPEHGEELYMPPHPSIDVGRDGALYVAWHRVEPDQSARLMLATSTDGGRTWAPERALLPEARRAFRPTVAVAPNGTVGMTYMDLRRDVGGDGEVTTQWLFAHSHDRGRTWSERELAGPFDYLRSTSNDGEVSVGDVFGLAPAARGFASVLVQAKPSAVSGATDIYYARLKLEQRRRPRRGR